MALDSYNLLFYFISIQNFLQKLAIFLIYLILDVTEEEWESEGEESFHLINIGQLSSAMGLHRARQGLRTSSSVDHQGRRLWNGNKKSSI